MSALAPALESPRSQPDPVMPTGAGSAAYRRPHKMDHCSQPSSERRRSRSQQSTGRDLIALKWQQIDDARPLEGAMDESRPGNQRKAISLSSAETVAKRDHSHPDRVDVRELTEIQRDVGDPFFAKTLDLHFEQGSR